MMAVWAIMIIASVVLKVFFFVLCLNISIARIAAGVAPMADARSSMNSGMRVWLFLARCLS